MNLHILITTTLPHENLGAKPSFHQGSYELAGCLIGTYITTEIIAEAFATTQRNCAGQVLRSRRGQFSTRQALQTG